MVERSKQNKCAQTINHLSMPIHKFPRICYDSHKNIEFFEVSIKISQSFMAELIKGTSIILRAFKVVF